MMSETAVSLVSWPVLLFYVSLGQGSFQCSLTDKGECTTSAEYTAKLNGVSYVAEAIGNGTTTSSSGGSAKSPSGSSTSGSGSVSSTELNGGAMSAATWSTTGMAMAAAAAGGLLVLLA